MPTPSGSGERDADDNKRWFKDINYYTDIDVDFDKNCNLIGYSYTNQDNERITHRYSNPHSEHDANGATDDYAAAERYTNTGSDLYSDAGRR